MYMVSEEELISLFDHIDRDEEQEQLKQILTEILCDHFNKRVPQRVLLCGVDYRSVWRFLWQTCTIDGLYPSHWCAENIKDAKAVDAVLQNMVYAHDDHHSARECHRIAFISDADLMSDEVQIALAHAMDSKASADDICFIMATEKPVNEMKELTHWMLCRQLTDVWSD